MAETNNEKKSYLVKIRKDDDGWLIAEVKDLPGCFASGEDLDELKEALEEAVGLYLSTSDVRVTVEFGEAERVFGVIDGDGDGEAEMPADFDFALAR
jgi:predicted RNase H-like HicB family nuclease